MIGGESSSTVMSGIMHLDITSKLLCVGSLVTPISLVWRTQLSLPIAGAGDCSRYREKPPLPTPHPQSPTPPESATFLHPPNTKVHVTASSILIWWHQSPLQQYSYLSKVQWCPQQHTVKKLCAHNLVLNQLQTCTTHCVCETHLCAKYTRRGVV
jgi:hypothetical protein